MPIDACYELVGHLRRLWRGFDGGREAHVRHGRLLRPGPETGADDDLAFEVLEARAEPHAAVPTIMLRVRVTETGGRTVHALVLRGQIRIEPQRRRYRPSEEERLYELFGETPGGVTRCARSCGRTFRPRFRGFTRRPPSSTCPWSAPTTSRWRPPSTCTPCRAARSRCSCCSRARCSPAASGVSAEPISWDSGGVVPPPGVGVAGGHGPLLSQQRLGARSSRDTLDRLQRFKSAQAVPTWDQAFDVLLKQAGEDGP